MFYYDGENYAATIARQQADDHAAELQRKQDAAEKKLKARPSDVTGLKGAAGGGGGGAITPRMSTIGGNSRLSFMTPSKPAHVTALAAAAGANTRASMYLRSSGKILAPSASAANAANAKAVAPSTAPASAKAKPASASTQAMRLGLPAAPLFDTPLKAAVTGVKLGAAAASANLAANAAANAAQAAANVAAVFKPAAPPPPPLPPLPPLPPVPHPPKARNANRRMCRRRRPRPQPLPQRVRRPPRRPSQSNRRKRK